MKEQFKSQPEMAKPSIPVENPQRRLVPEIISPIPQRKPTPSIPNEPVRTREPVPARR